MKRLLLAAIGSTLAFNSYAQPSFQPSGSNLVYGANSVSQSAITSTANPAAGASALQQEGDTRFRMGLITAGFGYEVGKFDNFEQKLDQLITKTNNGSVATIGEATALINEFNALMPVVSTDGYAAFNFGAHAPLTPLLIASDMLGGAITLDISAGVNAKVNVLDDNIAYDVANLKLDTEDTSLLVRGGSILELSLGYSRNIFTSDSGALYMGVRPKMISVELGQQNVILSTTKDVGDALDDFDKTTVEDDAISIDLGMLWVSKNYQLGVTGTNLTSPSFEYQQLSAATICAGRIGSALTRCQEAFSDQVYEMDAQFRVEGALHSESRNWLITFAYDTNETETPTGDKQQWTVVGMGYSPESWIIPGIRAGYRANQTGSELSYATLGLTLFKALNLDVAYGLESTTVDGDDVPRSAMVNLSTELRF